jgi:hypothetical protein
MKFLAFLTVAAIALIPVWAFVFNVVLGGPKRSGWTKGRRSRGMRFAVTLAWASVLSPEAGRTD